MRRNRTERIAPQPRRKNADLEIHLKSKNFSKMLNVNVDVGYMNWAKARGFDDIFFFSSGLQAPVNQKR